MTGKQPGRLGRLEAKLDTLITKLASQHAPPPRPPPRTPPPPRPPPPAGPHRGGHKPHPTVPSPAGPLEKLLVRYSVGKITIADGQDERKHFLVACTMYDWDGKEDGKFEG